MCNGRAEHIQVDKMLVYQKIKQDYTSVYKYRSESEVFPLLSPVSRAELVAICNVFLSFESHISGSLIWHLESSHSG